MIPNFPNYTQFGCSTPGELFKSDLGLAYYVVIRTEPDTVIICDLARSILAVGEPMPIMSAVSPMRNLSPLIEIYHAIMNNEPILHAQEYEAFHRAIGAHVHGQGPVAISWVSGDTLLYTVVLE